MDSAELFSPNIETRYKASIAYGQEHQAPFAYWPRGCWGSANAWLMLCGPSPGRADDNEQRSLGGGNRPKDVPVKIGKDAGKIDFQSGKGRTKRWRNLVCAVFGDEAQGHSLTCLANLDWGHYGNHRDIPPANLEQGPATVLEVMKACQPCVVITLVTVTWIYLEAHLRQYSIAPDSQPPTIAGKKPLQYRVMNLPRCMHKTLLLKSPQHPSRHFFTDIHCQQIAVTVKWFRETYLYNGGEIKG